MPHVPKWIADSMESLLSSKYLQTIVSSTVDVNPEIRKVAFAADLNGLDFYPGCAVILRVGPNDLRHYTISAFDRTAGLFEILFHTHGKGPGSNLAAKLEPGETLKMTVPGGRKLYAKEKQQHFFFGDETSLSFYALLIQEIKANGQQCFGILELLEQNLEVPSLLGFEMETVVKTPDHPAQKAIALLNTRFEKDHLAKCVFYLTGNVASLQEFRKTLKQMGISSKNIKFQGYWDEGSIGL